MNANTRRKEGEDLFKIVLDTVSAGVTVIDNDLKIQYQNKIIVQLFGSKRICISAGKSGIY
jgi:PAS domain-containing protein